MPTNEMASLARSNGKPVFSSAHAVAGRPPVVAWSLRLLLCATDQRTQDGDLVRLLDHARDELTAEEVSVIFETTKACLAEIRKGGRLVAELHPSQRTSTPS